MHSNTSGLINFSHNNIQKILNDSFSNLPDSPIPVRSMFIVLQESFSGFFTHLQTSQLGEWLNKLSITT